MTRWSLDYPSFDSVEPPAPDEWYHPSLYTEWIRFQCRQIISYVNEQADIIHSLSDAPVGTDMMPHNILGYYDVNEKLDVIQYNHYDPAAKLYTNTFAYDFLLPDKKSAPSGSPRLRSAGTAAFSPSAATVRRATAMPTRCSPSPSEAR